MSLLTTMMRKDDTPYKTAEPILCIKGDLPESVDTAMLTTQHQHGFWTTRPAKQIASYSSARKSVVEAVPSRQLSAYWDP